MADGEHGFLGLTHNPFATDDNQFFEGGNRKTCVEQLRHLAQWSRRTTLVTGPLGVGKSSLYRQLSMTLEPGVKAARINGVLVNTLREVLSAVAQGVGASVSSEANSQTLAEVLATYFIGQERQGRFCLILVDDAHLLDFGSMEELLKLTRNSPVRLCLFGEPSLAGLVTRPAQRQELAWHEIRLSAFTLEETEAYIAWKLGLAQFRGKLPFSASQLARVQKLSGGLPAQINQICADLVERLESGQPERSGARFPVAHGLVVVLLVVVVSLAYLVLSGIEPEETPVGETGPRELTRTTIPLPGTESPDGPGTGVESADTLPVDETGGAIDDSASTEGVNTESLDLPSPGVVAASGDSDAPAAAPVPAAPVLTPMPEPSEVQARRDSATLPATEPPTVAASPDAPSEAAPPPVSRSDVPASTRGADWLLAQSPGAFTVQLASFSTEDRLRSYLGQQKDPSRFGWYPIERGGKRLFVVTYGQFATKTEAMQAAGALPPETGKVEPWVRPMSMVQEAIRGGQR